MLIFYGLELFSHEMQGIEHSVGVAHNFWQLFSSNSLQATRCSYCTYLWLRAFTVLHEGATCKNIKIISVYKIYSKSYMNFTLTNTFYTNNNNSAWLGETIRPWNLIGIRTVSFVQNFANLTIKWNVSNNAVLLIILMTIDMA